MTGYNSRLTCCPNNHKKKNVKLVNKTKEELEEQDEALVAAQSLLQCIKALQIYNFVLPKSPA